ncbi:MAG: leucine-rich repeat protein [Huintestinicola sp.]
MKKRILSIAAAFVFALGSFVFSPAPVNEHNSVSAAQTSSAKDFVLKKTTSGKVFVSAYKGKGGTVTIPSGVNYIGNNAFKDNYDITGVIIPEGCSGGIGKNAFKNCVNLTFVDIMGDQSYIADNAFDNCTSLEHVIFEDRSADLGYIGEKAFINCFSLKGISLPEGTDEICDYAFENCLNLTSAVVPKNVAFIGKKAFGYMYNSVSDIHTYASGKTEEYIRYNELIDGELTEWYSKEVQKAVTICGIPRSTAEKYAKANNMQFVSIAENLKAPKVSAASDPKTIQLSWTNVAGADTYRVDIYNSSKGRFETFKTVNASKITVNVQKSNYEVVFLVTALRKNKSEYIELSSSGIFGTKTQPAAVKDAPAELKLSASADTSSISLSWNSVKGADAYDIYIYNEATGKYAKYKQVNVCRYKISKAKSGTDYKIYVAAVKRNGKTNTVLLKSDVIEISTASVNHSNS